MAWIKKVYLYLVSLISLVIFIIAAIMLINMGLKAWVFKKADNTITYAPQVMCSAPPGVTDYKAPTECSDPNYNAKQKQTEADQRSSQRQRDAAQAVAMIIVATPVFLYHWRLARKEA